jgi:integrase
MSVNKVSEIIDICTSKRNDGTYVILSLNEIEKKGFNVRSFDNVILWNVKSTNLKIAGDVKFGGDTWYSYENAKRHLIFPSDGSEMSLQLRVYALTCHFNGRWEGGTPIKISTLQTQVTYLNKTAIWLANKGYKSFHQLERLPEMTLRTLLFQYLTKCLDIQSLATPPRFLDDIFNSHNSLGLIGDKTSKCLNEVITELFDYKKALSGVTLSHPIIPTGIMKKILSFSADVVENCQDKIEDWEAANDKIIAYLNEQDIPDSKKNVTQLIDKAASASGVHKSIKELADHYFDELRLAVYIDIIAYTGMRYQEALSCCLGCATLQEEVFYVEALTTKTTDSLILDDWIANKDTYEAILLFERYVKGMRKRAKILIKKFSGVITHSQLHNLQAGIKEKRLFGVSDSVFSISFARNGRFTDFDVTSPLYKSKWDLTLDNNDIKELERLELNYTQIRGKERGKPYQLGDDIRITNHMFRHTFAYFVVANKLGEAEDIAEQFKHLSAAMTKVYTDKGILSHEELANLVDGFENLMIKKVGDELAEQADEQTLRGGGGETYNKVARDLVIGITDSNTSNANVIRQIHFKDLNELRLFLTKNVEMIRGLPQGYCTAGDACKIKGAAVPAGCVYCGSFIIAERHKPHWVAIKNKAISKLEAISTLSPEKQRELELFVIHYKKDLHAAEYALGQDSEEAKHSEVYKNE